MHIPRNASLPSPSFLDVRLSGLVEGSKAAIVWAYPGGEPRRNLRGAPRGFLFVYNDGLAFLATGEKDFSSSELIDLLADEAANKVIPVGSLLLTIYSFARDMRAAEREIPEKLDRALFHPDTFVIPFVDLVESQHQVVGSLLTGRTLYARLSREQADGSAQQYWITPVDAESVEAFMILRLAAEKRAVAQRLLRNYVDVDTIRSTVMQELHSGSGGVPDERIAGIGSEITARIEQSLHAQGLTVEAIEQQALEELGHFRERPEFAKYYRRP